MKLSLLISAALASVAVAAPFSDLEIHLPGENGALETRQSGGGQCPPGTDGSMGCAYDTGLKKWWVVMCNHGTPTLITWCPDNWACQFAAFQYPICYPVNTK